MKKCKDCDREIDKYAIACQYCGKMLKKSDDPDHDDQLGTSPESEDNTENNPDNHGGK